MAFLGGLPGILASGTTAGLGTAEQQRARQDAIMRFGLNLAMEQAKLEETKRQHNLQEKPVDITAQYNAIMGPLGYPEKPPGGMVVPRRSEQGFYGALGRAGAAPFDINYDPLNLDVVGETRRGQAPVKIPGTPAIFGGPEATPQQVEDYGGTTGPVPILSPATPERTASRTTEAGYSRLRGQAEKRKAEQEKAQKVQDIASARADMRLPDADLDAVLAKYPRLDAKDITGSTLAAPEKPEKPKDVVDPRTGEITRINPDGTWKTIKAGTPDEGRTLDIEYKRLRNEKALLDKSTADLIDALRTGKPVDFKQARLAQGQYTTTGQKLIQAADFLPADHPDKVTIIESGADSLKTAAEIGRLMKDRGKVPPAPGEAPKTAEDYLKLRRKR